jgi:hypothetical protein
LIEPHLEREHCDTVDPSHTRSLHRGTLHNSHHGDNTQHQRRLRKDTSSGNATPEAADATKEAEDAGKQGRG